jgi:hypothetical protein
LIVTRMGFPLEWLRRLSPRERIRMPVPVETQASFRRTPAKGCRRARAPRRGFCNSRRVVKRSILLSEKQAILACNPGPVMPLYVPGFVFDMRPADSTLICHLA